MVAKIPRSLTGLLVLSCFIACFASSLSAQYASKEKRGGEIDVTNVKFSPVRIPSMPNAAWYEADVELQAKPASDGNRFVSRVKVTLNLGIEVSGTGAKRIEFYRAEAEAITIEAGKSNVRFYLPPEIVKRDSVRGDAKYYLVELSIGGQPVPLARSHVSATSLANPEAVNSFKSKVASEAAANEGVLVPQYLTPFAYDGTRPAPTFVRSRQAGL